VNLVVISKFMKINKEGPHVKDEKSDVSFTERYQYISIICFLFKKNLRKYIEV